MEFTKKVGRVINIFFKTSFWHMWKTNFCPSAIIFNFLCFLQFSSTVIFSLRFPPRHYRVSHALSIWLKWKRSSKNSNGPLHLHFQRLISNWVLSMSRLSTLNVPKTNISNFCFNVIVYFYIHINDFSEFNKEISEFTKQIRQNGANHVINQSSNYVHKRLFQRQFCPVSNIFRWIIIVLSVAINLKYENFLLSNWHAWEIIVSF